MKKRLQEHFGEKIILIEINGKSNVATFRTTARAMLHEYYKQLQQEKNTTEEKMKLAGCCKTHQGRHQIYHNDS